MESRGVHVAMVGDIRLQAVVLSGLSNYRQQTMTTMWSPYDWLLAVQMILSLLGGRFVADLLTMHGRTLYITGAYEISGCWISISGGTKVCRTVMDAQPARASDSSPHDDDLLPSLGRQLLLTGWRCVCPAALY